PALCLTRLQLSLRRYGATDSITRRAHGLGAIRADRPAYAPRFTMAGLRAPCLLGYRGSRVPHGANQFFLGTSRRRVWNRLRLRGAQPSGGRRLASACATAIAQMGFAACAIGIHRPPAAFGDRSVAAVPALASGSLTTLKLSKVLLNCLRLRKLL